MRHQLRRPLHGPPRPNLEKPASKGADSLQLSFRGCRLSLAACGMSRTTVKTDGYLSDNASPPAQPSPLLITCSCYRVANGQRAAPKADGYSFVNAFPTTQPLPSSYQVLYDISVGFLQLLVKVLPLNG